MEGVAQHETGPRVSLEQAVAVAKQHTWARVGFTIGLITYAMATVWFQRAIGLSDDFWLALFAVGIALIAWSGYRWHRAAKATMASASVIDGHGRVLGRADEVARREIEHRVINFWRFGHNVARPRQVLSDDAPIPTHRPRERRGTPRRRR